MSSAQGGGSEGGPQHQGGAQEGQGAPPQQPGWGQPPSSPPYGPPPGQGYAQAPPPPPPGYGPYGGYGPAPSAPPGWGAAAPAPMERPVTVRAGLGLFIAEIALGLIATIYVFSNFDDLVNRALAQAQERTGTTVPLTASDLRGVLVAAAIIGLVFVAIELLFVWFAWVGRNWARIVLWVVGGLGIVSGIAGVAQSGQYGGFYRTLGIFQLLFIIAAVVFLALKPSNEWYRYRKWQRMTGQR